MTNDLVKRLRNVQFWQAECDMRMQAAARIEELEERLKAALVDSLKSKILKQRNEIARLTKKLEAVTKEKSYLLRDLKWMRGENDE